MILEFVPRSLLLHLSAQSNAKKLLSPELVQSYAFQLLSATAYIHSQGIIHRDLRPANLMLNSVGLLKIGNFEYARIRDGPLVSGESDHKMIQYSAPEILIGVSECNEKVDVWSCGCIIAELVRLAPIFAGDSGIDQLARICAFRGRPPIGNWPEFDAAALTHTLPIPETPPNLGAMFQGLDVPETLLNLLDQLLTLDPRDRITAEQARKHPYFAEVSNVLRAQCEPLVQS
jgi:serine/threonine protein kinase